MFVLTVTLMWPDKGRSRGPVMDGAAQKTDAVIRGHAVVHHTFRFWTLTLNERPIALSESSGVRRRKRRPGTLMLKESDQGCHVGVKYQRSNSSQTQYNVPIAKTSMTRSTSCVLFLLYQQTNYKCVELPRV